MDSSDAIRAVADYAADDSKSDSDSDSDGDNNNLANRNNNKNGRRQLFDSGDWSMKM
jgi:hypothetical protein